METTMPPKSKQPATDKLAPYAFHGQHLTVKAGQGVGDCPICGKSNHFYVSPKTGQYDCKSCGESGNVYTFLAHVHKQALAITGEAAYRALSKHRKGIPWTIYQQAGLALDGTSWLIPIYNVEGNLVNLRRWDGPGSHFMNTAGLATHFYGLEQLQAAKPDTTVLICEGEWDSLALRCLIHRVAGYADVFTVLGVPGSTTLKDEWHHYVKGRDVVLLYDHDDSGYRGMDYAEKKLTGVVKSLRKIIWPKGTPPKFDVNDHLAKYLKQPKAGIDELLGYCSFQKDKAGSDSERKRLFKSRPTFKQVVNEFRAVLHLTKETEGSLAVMLATLISNRLPEKDCPVWLFLVGPPSCGKTEFLRSAKDAPLTWFESTLRPQTLISGYKFTGEDSDRDPSLIPKIIGKSLIVKDWTEIMELNSSVQDELNGVLRGAYDGEAMRTFAHGVSRNYPDCHFSLVTGVTGAIHTHDKTQLGERFLKMNFLGRGRYDQDKHIASAISDDKPGIDRKARMKDAVYEFLDFNLDEKRIPKLNQPYRDRLNCLAQILGSLRASVSRSRQGELMAAPEAELGSRVGRQLKKIAVSLAIVLGKPAVDDECFALVERVALDSVPAWNLNVASALIRQHPKPGEVHGIAYECQMAYANVNRRLENMLELGIINRHKLETEGRGRPTYGYQLSDHFVSLWKRAKIDAMKFKPVLSKMTAPKIGKR